MSADIVDLTKRRQLRRIDKPARGATEWQLLNAWAATSHSVALARAVRRLGDLPADRHADLIIVASYRMADRRDADEVGRSLLAILDAEAAGGDA